MVFKALPLTRNSRKPIKGSNDSDFNLVYKKNFNKILPSSGWVQGQVNVAKIVKNPPHI